MHCSSGDTGDTFFITNPLDGTYVNGIVEVTVESAKFYGASYTELWIDDSCVAVLTSGTSLYSWDTRDYTHGSEHTLQGIMYNNDGYGIVSPLISVTVYSRRNVAVEAFLEPDACGFDYLAEKALTDSLASYCDTMVVVCYHLSGSYESSYSRDRQMFYNAGCSTPYVIFDGTTTVWEQNPGQYEEAYEAAFLTARDSLPSFALDARGMASSTSGMIAIQAIALQTMPEAARQVVAVVLEDSLAGVYGCHTKVCRYIASVVIDPCVTYPDTIQAVLPFNHTIPIHNMSAAVFIQDMSAKQILQCRLVRFE